MHTAAATCGGRGQQCPRPDRAPSDGYRGSAISSGVASSSRSTPENGGCSSQQSKTCTCGGCWALPLRRPFDAYVASAAFNKVAVTRGRDVKAVILPSDKGTQPGFNGFAAACRRLIGVTQSMGHVGTALDSAPSRVVLLYGLGTRTPAETRPHRRPSRQSDRPSPGVLRRRAAARSRRRARNTDPHGSWSKKVSTPFLG